MKCHDCNTKGHEILFDDPRDPPLADKPCLCRVCCTIAHDELIIDAIEHLNGLRQKRKELTMPPVREFKVGDRVRVRGYRKIVSIEIILRDIDGGVVLDESIGGFTHWNVSDLTLARKQPCDRQRVTGIETKRTSVNSAATLSPRREPRRIKSSVRK